MAYLILGYIGECDVFLENRCVTRPFGIAVTEDKLVVGKSDEKLQECRALFWRER